MNPVSTDCCTKIGTDSAGGFAQQQFRMWKWGGHKKCWKTEKGNVEQHPTLPATFEFLPLKLDVCVWNWISKNAEMVSVKLNLLGSEQVTTVNSLRPDCVRTSDTVRSVSLRCYAGETQRMSQICCGSTGTRIWSLTWRDNADMTKGIRTTVQLPRLSLPFSLLFSPLCDYGDSNWGPLQAMQSKVVLLRRSKLNVIFVGWKCFVRTGNEMTRLWFVTRAVVTWFRKKY